MNDLGGSRDGTGHSDAALKVVEEIKAAGGDAMSNGGSVTEFEQMQEMVAKAKEAWGGVHILINNAGSAQTKAAIDLTEEDWTSIIDLNLNGVFRAAQAAAKQMIAAGKPGAILSLMSPSLRVQPSP